jgi:hypothetical protein
MRLGNSLEDLVSCMAEDAKLKADTKICLLERIETLRSRERQVQILAKSAANSE